MRVLLALGAAVIAYNSAEYFDPTTIAPFIIEKLPLAHDDLYVFALRAHVVSACFALPACLVLITTQCAHRWLGRVTGAVTLLVLVPSGSYLAFFAKGGALGTAGFLLTAVITGVAMIVSIRTARQRRFKAHRRASLHVLAQLSVAVSSRALLLIFAAAGLEEETAYLIALWLPVVGSAVVVERSQHVLSLLRFSLARRRRSSADRDAGAHRATRADLAARTQ